MISRPSTLLIKHGPGEEPLPVLPKFSSMEPTFFGEKRLSQFLHYRALAEDWETNSHASPFSISGGVRVTQYHTDNLPMVGDGQGVLVAEKGRGSTLKMLEKWDKYRQVRKLFFTFL